MDKKIEIVAEHQSEMKSALWVSLQLKNESISIGMRDKAFAVPGFVSEVEIDGTINRSFLNLDEEIIEPHYTYHSKGYYHLRANGKPELASGIMDIDIMVEQGDVVPCVRFVTSPIEKLKSINSFPNDREIQLVKYPVSLKNVSLGFDFSFVNRKVRDKNNLNTNQFIEWFGRILRVTYCILPPQKPTVSMIHIG